MDSHPSYGALSQFISKYPLAAGSLFQTYNDLLFGQQWSDVEVVDLPTCKRAAIRGKRSNSDEVLNVVPCSLSESLSLAWLCSAFQDLSDPKEIFVSITSEDASLVYYKLSAGIVKPSV